MRVKVIVTKKGSLMKSNSWKEGQEIEVSFALRDQFLQRGIITLDKEEIDKPILIDEPKLTKKREKEIMKKLLSILCLLTFGLNAQVVSTMVLSATHFTNTTAVTATLQTNVCAENISIQAIATKSTGTVAGSVTVSGSVDGTNYVNQPDTFGLTDITTNAHIFEYTDNKFLYWKVTFLGIGTMDAVPAAYLFSSGLGNKHIAVNMLSPFSAVKDTTTNTAESYVTIPVGQWYDNITIQSVVTKISGTVAGTVTLQGSIDGTNYQTVDSNYANSTSYVPTNVTTNTFMFVVTGSPYRYYRLSYTGAGTMSASHRGYLLPNKK